MTARELAVSQKNDWCNIAITLLEGSVGLSGVNECNRLITTADPQWNELKAVVRRTEQPLIRAPLCSRGGS